jgi:hypothetical protein
MGAGGGKMGAVKRLASARGAADAVGAAMADNSDGTVR